MESDKDHIKKVFSSKLSNFEPDLPDFIWDKIDADLSKQSVVKNMPIRKKMYQVMTTVAAVAAVVFAVLYLLPQQQDEAVIPIVQLTEHNSVGDILKLENKAIESKPLLAMNTQSENHQRTKLSNNQKTETFVASLIGESERKEADLIEKRFVDSKSDTLSSNNVFVAEKSKEKELQILKVEDKSFEKDLSKQIAAFESKGEELNNMLSSTDASGGSSNNSSFQLGLEGGSGFSKSNDTKNQLNSMHQGSTVALRSGKVKLKHNQPILFGVGVSKRITNKISIETGLNYAYVSSKIRNDDDRYVKQKDAQYFHYLGLPLTLNYTFTEWKRFRFYTSLGVLFQKDIYGRIRSNLYSDGISKVDETDEVKISQKHLQFSTSAALGVSYPIYDKLRVYSNFGTSYYFDAKNEYETIYSDKKWLFNLNLGIKFEF